MAKFLSYEDRLEIESCLKAHMTLTSKFPLALILYTCYNIFKQEI